MDSVRRILMTDYKIALNNTVKGRKDSPDA